MATTIDHLRDNYIVRVIQDFADARGVAHHVGEQGRIVKIALNWKTSEISIEWDRDGQLETMFFDPKDRVGPGNNRMKEYFELGEYVELERLDRKFVPVLGWVRTAGPPLPELTDGLISTDARLEDGLDRAWALAGHSRFEEAVQQLTAVVYATDRRGDNNQRAAEKLCTLAREYAFDANHAALYQWLREEGIGLWYGWGSGAGSGGEGAYRATYIRAAEKVFADIDKAREGMS